MAKKKFKSKVVRGPQQSLPLKTAKAKREWKKSWKVSPLINGRVPAPLAKAWFKHVGKRKHGDVFREALAKACGFSLKALAKAGE